MSEINENSLKIDEQYHPKAPLNPEKKVVDKKTDAFCLHKVQCLPLKVSTTKENHEVALYMKYCIWMIVACLTCRQHRCNID